MTFSEVTVMKFHKVSTYAKLLEIVTQFIITRSTSFSGSRMAPTDS